MAKIMDYPSLTAPNASTVILVDGDGGTKKMLLSDLAASEMFGGGSDIDLATLPVATTSTATDKFLVYSGGANKTMTPSVLASNASFLNKIDFSKYTPLTSATVAATRQLLIGTGTTFNTITIDELALSKAFSDRYSSLDFDKIDLYTSAVSGTEQLIINNLSTGVFKISIKSILGDPALATSVTNRSNLWSGLQEVSLRFDGLKMKKITQEEYDALATKDPNTVYFVTGSVGS